MIEHPPERPHPSAFNTAGEPRTCSRCGKPAPRPRAFGTFLAADTVSAIQHALTGCGAGSSAHPSQCQASHREEGSHESRPDARLLSTYFVTSHQSVELARSPTLARHLLRSSKKLARPSTRAGDCTRSQNPTRRHCAARHAVRRLPQRRSPAEALGPAGAWRGD